MKDAPRIKWLVEPTYDDDGVQRSAGIDQFGREHGDATSMLAPELGVGVDRTYDAIHKTLIRERAAFMAAVESEHFETEEEANDFLIPDELFPPGNEPWEDIHLFPAPGDEGRGDRLATAASNGENRAPEDATRQPSGTVSEGSVSPSRMMGRSDQMPKSDIDTDVPPESSPVRRSTVSSK